MDTEYKVVLDEKEVEAAERAAEDAPGVYTLTLAKPFTYEDITADKLTFDFEGLTVADSLAVEQELVTLGKPVIVRELNGDYLLRIACRACETKVSVDFLMRLPIRAGNNLMSAVRSFLMRAE